MPTATDPKLPDAFYSSRLLDTHQAMEMLGVCKGTLFKHLNNKEDPLPSHKIGRKRMFQLDQVLWWIEKH